VLIGCLILCVFPVKYIIAPAPVSWDVGFLVLMCDPSVYAVIVGHCGGFAG